MLLTARIVDSSPPSGYIAEVNEVTGLSARARWNQSGPAMSRYCFSCAAGLPKRTGVPKAKPSAHSRSSSVASSTVPAVSSRYFGAERVLLDRFLGSQLRDALEAYF